MRINAGDLTELLELDLFSSGWDGSNDFYPGMPVRQFAMTHLHKSLTKKYLPGTKLVNVEGDVAAMDLFTKVNESCRTWHLDTNRMDSLDEVIVGEVKSLIERFFYPAGQDFILSLNSIYAGLDVGPGANLGASETDWFSKFASSTLTTTDQGLYVLYRDAIRNDPKWIGMEHSRFAERGLRVVTGSRLSFVPKTTKISRTICTEPILNMMFQKGIAKVLESRLRAYFGIDLSTQPIKNSALARVGSQSGEFGTIDLSSASDSISKSLCKEILPSRVFDLLMRCRCPSTVKPNGEVLELHMISSMGNAFTFPLQTLIFAAVVAAVYKAYGVKLEKPSHALGNFAVFGDDIIVQARCYNRVCKVLSLLGFSVNSDKSFNEGPFRESCGHDYFHGHDVRGVYIKHLRDANDCYSAINRLVRWSVEHGAVLENLISFLKSRCRFLPIPPDEMDDAGIKVPLSCVSRLISHPTIHGARMYRVSRLVGRRVNMLSTERKPRLDGWIENPDGELLAFLRGSIRTGFISLRTNTRKAVIRKKYSSRWDYIPPDQAKTPGYTSEWLTLAGLLFCHK